MPDANPATPVLCEPARSKCTWAFQKSYFVWKLIGKSPRTPPGTSFCASLRGRNAHGHVTRGILNVAHVAHGHRFPEPAQSKCTWTYHKSQSAWKFTGIGRTRMNISIEHRASTVISVATLFEQRLLHRKKYKRPAHTTCSMI